MAMMKSNKENYNHVSFDTIKGSYSMSKKNYEKYKGQRFNVVYYIVNND